jgi:PPM family protein phosphatase
MSASPPPQAIRWSGVSDVGRFRANNEDAFLALTFGADGVRFLGKEGAATVNGADFVFAVSDGMGGASSGEFASRIAVEKITRILPGSFRLGAQSLETGCQDFLTELFDAIHAEMLRFGRAYEECAGMGATLSLCWFRPDRVWFAHVGDSRIYYLPHEGGMTQLTHDHTHVGWLLRQGKLNEREARGHPRRNALSQALGAANQFLTPHIGAVRCQRGDRLLLCTDGVTDGLWDRQIEELVREPGEGCMAPRLVQAAIEHSGRDNCTAVVVEFV